MNCSRKRLFLNEIFLSEGKNKKCLRSEKGGIPNPDLYDHGKAGPDSRSPGHCRDTESLFNILSVIVDGIPDGRFDGLRTHHHHFHIGRERQFLLLCFLQ